MNFRAGFPSCSGVEPSFIQQTKPGGAVYQPIMAGKTKNTGQASLQRRWLRSRRVRTLAALAALLLLLPAVFTLVYALPGARPVSTLMAGRLLTGKPVDRQWVALEDVSPFVFQSVIMSEDGQFCFHYGIDLAELNAVISDALEGEKPRGASTIPMQTVKNLFLWPQRSFVRKAFEIPYAVFADLVWSKKRMFEIYINIAEFDEGVFGIEAASRHYFNRSSARLTRRQAALLTVSLPNPRERNPAKPTKSLSRLASVIEKRGQRSGAYVKCLE